MDTAVVAASESRPATFEQAFAAEGSQPSIPSSETTPADSASADARVPPAETETPDGSVSTEPAGPIPLERHKAILDGAYKERDSLKTEFETFKQQYGWAAEVNREQFQQFVTLAQKMRTDPVAFLGEYVAELQAHPTYGPQVKSQAARILGQRAVAQEQPIEAGIPVMDERGQIVARTYTADQIQQVVDRAIQAALGKEVGPVKETLGKMTAEREQAEFQTKLTQATDRILSDVQKLPHFEALKTEIGKAMEQMPADMPPGEAIYRAYVQVVGPKLTDKAKADVLASLEQKAAAGTVNPSKVAVAPPIRPKSFDDPRLQWT